MASKNYTNTTGKKAAICSAFCVAGLAALVFGFQNCAKQDPPPNADVPSVVEERPFTGPSNPVKAGEAFTLRWTLKDDAQSATLKRLYQGQHIGGTLDVEVPTGQYETKLSDTSTFHLTVTNADGNTTNHEVEVEVTGARIVVFDAQANSVAQGGTVTLFWQSKEATSAVLQEGRGLNPQEEDYGAAMNVEPSHEGYEVTKTHALSTYRLKVTDSEGHTDTERLVVSSN